MEILLQRAPRTSAEQIHQRLAARIISGDLKPGTALDETGLATEFAVSRTPIREALRLLRASGLVQQKAHAKAVVAEPDDATLVGMFEVMGYLEALCAGLSALAMTRDERQALDDLHAGMAAVVRNGDHQGYVEANETFHSAIYAGAHNAYLSEITQSTRQRLRPFRRAQFQLPGRLSRSHAEHAAVVESILRADRPAAEQAMRTHISTVEDAVHALGFAAAGD